MTTLSTHDTKRAEDVRARIAVLTEIPDEWRDAVTRWSSAAARHWQPPGPDRNMEYLIWQTLVGTWPIDGNRLVPYVEKAAREAAVHTAWVDGDAAYDEALRLFTRRILADEAVTNGIADFVARIERPAFANSLAQKLVQLTMPGVPDVYQGCECVDLSLVDPDNRRPVDFAARTAALASGSDAKTRVVTAALRARRDRPETFGPDAAYAPMMAAGAAAAHVIAFGRGDDVVIVAARLSHRLAVTGGWGETTLTLPSGQWTDLIDGRKVDGGQRRIADLLDAFPVALLGKTSRTSS